MSRKMKTITGIIGILSLVIMILWGYVGGDWGHSWLALIVGGIIIAVIKMIVGDDDDAKGESRGKTGE